MFRGKKWAHPTFSVMYSRRRPQYCSKRGCKSSMAKSEFTLAFNEITETHHLPRETVIEALEQALVSAYRRDSGASPAQHVEAEIDLTTNHHTIKVEMEVVSSVWNEKSHTEIALDDALKLNPEAKLGDMVMAPVVTEGK